MVGVCKGDTIFLGVTFFRWFEKSAKDLSQGVELASNDMLTSANADIEINPSTVNIAMYPVFQRIAFRTVSFLNISPGGWKKDMKTFFHGHANKLRGTFLTLEKYTLEHAQYLRLNCDFGNALLETTSDVVNIVPNNVY